MRRLQWSAGVQALQLRGELRSLGGLKKALFVVSPLQRTLETFMLGCPDQDWLDRSCPPDPEGPRVIINRSVPPPPPPRLPVSGTSADVSRPCTAVQCDVSVHARSIVLPLCSPAIHKPSIRFRVLRKGAAA